jgi:hypothetical protein
MSKILTIQEEIHCDIYGKEIHGDHKTEFAGTLYLTDESSVQYGVKLTLSKYCGKDAAEHVCRDCLRDFLENLAKNLTY